MNYTSIKLLEKKKNHCFTEDRLRKDLLGDYCSHPEEEGGLAQGGTRGGGERWSGFGGFLKRSQQISGSTAGGV